MEILGTRRSLHPVCLLFFPLRSSLRWFMTCLHPGDSLWASSQGDGLFLGPSTTVSSYPTPLWKPAIAQRKSPVTPVKSNSSPWSSGLQNCVRFCVCTSPSVTASHRALASAGSSASLRGLHPSSPGGRPTHFPLSAHPPSFATTPGGLTFPLLEAGTSPFSGRAVYGCRSTSWLWEAMTFLFVFLPQATPTLLSSAL